MKKLLIITLLLLVGLAVYINYSHAQVIDLTKSMVDSTDFRDGTIPGDKLTNPLRYTGNIYLTGNVDATGNVTGANLMYKADFRDSLTAALALEQLLPLPDFADTTISAQDSVTVKLLADIDGGKGRNKKVVAYGNGTTAVDSLTLVSTFSPLTQYADTLVVWVKTADNTNTLFSVQIRDNDGAVLFSSGKIQVGADDTMTRFAWALSDFATVDEKMLLYGITLQNAADVMELGQAYIKRIQ